MASPEKTNGAILRLTGCERALESATDGIVKLDKQGKYTYPMLRLREFWAHMGGEQVGRGEHLLFHLADEMTLSIGFGSHKKSTGCPWNRSSAP